MTTDATAGPVTRRKIRGWVIWLLGPVLLLGVALGGAAIWEKYRELSFQESVQDLSRQGVTVYRQPVRPGWVAKSAWRRYLPEWVLGVFDRKRTTAILNRDVPTEALEKVSRLPGLGDLQFRNGTRVTDEVLAHLQGCRDLDYLSAAGGRVTVAGLRHLGALPALRIVVLRGVAVDDAGLAYLQTLKQLQFVGVSRVHEASLGMGLNAVIVRGPGGRDEVRAGDVPNFQVEITSKIELPESTRTVFYLRKKNDHTVEQANGIVAWADATVTLKAPGVYEARVQFDQVLEVPGDYEVEIALSLGGTPVWVTLGTHAFVVRERVTEGLAR